MGDDGGICRAPDAERKIRHKQDVQRDVQKGGHGEEDERDRRVSEGAQKAGKKVIEGGGDDTGKNDCKVLPHPVPDFRRNAQKRKDRIEQEEYRDI